ncbi:hypothetical protein IC757_14330 [Wenzhouxiangella sp. AB-CW3]|uniref:hypothetical protein n=1 Tax=Wenzhouxiangella sp. AB-CW3 TaxID=2771012 RepID=UPI00168AFC81|nr:hypothetical protein [Wenzhouxiangella sp. AB-CW3]QOC22179.1 hypothetical protein IC757_14330 [Wenzhouxiangella sp. AB-CW3]
MRFAFLTLTAIVVLLLAAAGLGGFFDGQRTHMPPRADSGSAEVSAPVSREALEGLAANIDSIAREIDTQAVASVRADADDAPLLALAPRDLIDDRIAAAEPAPVLPDRRLSLIVLGSEPRAMIDGAMVTEASSLDRGGRVERIEGHQVVIQEREGRQVLTLSRDRVRRGTLENSSERDGS